MKNIQTNKQKAIDEKEVDFLIREYAVTRQHPSNILIHFVCIPLGMFSLLGLAWSIPFPYLEFLGRYNGYVNWASFLIAFGIYYYYRLSPVFSYMMLLLVFAMSMIVVQFEKWELLGGPALWLVSAFFLLLASVALFIGRKIEGKHTPLLNRVKFMLIGPIWILKLLSNKIGFKMR